MTIALWCVLIGALLPYAATGLAKGGGRMPVRQNHTPRDWLDKLEGWPKRAHWAQLNSFEVFPAFAAAVIVAQLTHATQSKADDLAMAWVAFRVLYLVMYLVDLAPLRTLSWTAGMACMVWLFFLGA
jgi:uncharacterized MAPEG superfamily protein